MFSHFARGLSDKTYDEVCDWEDDGPVLNQRRLSTRTTPCHVLWLACGRGWPRLFDWLAHS